MKSSCWAEGEKPDLFPNKLVKYMYCLQWPFLPPQAEHCLCLAVTDSLMFLRLDWYDSGWWSHQLQNMRPIPTLKSKECLTCIEITFQQNWSQKCSCWKLSARLGWIEFYYCSGWFIAMHLLNGCPVKNTFRVAGLGRLSAGCKHGHETFRQARNYNFRDKCVVFARNLKFPNLTQ